MVFEKQQVRVQKHFTCCKPIFSSRDVQHVLFWNSLTRWQWYSLSREEVQDLEDKSFEWENECWSFAFVQRISTDLETWSTYIEALTLEQVRVVIAVHYMNLHPNRVCAFGRFRNPSRAGFLQAMLPLQIGGPRLEVFQKKLLGNGNGVCFAVF